ncbi:T9SS type A sorting domain-containing protein [Aequorivita echinoideorum]|uniref:T9SS type A sorting domain-containing protein n=2 Tax=Aequorivita echinoideorum TaxID=1549647 RepID=A0ABS5S2S6_9FLAO|nr:T9SS type A sorting domain-containing protein [Aequorivita echinoideorum]
MYAQSSSKIWTSISERATESKAKEVRNSIPSDYKIYSLNSSALLSSLNNAPARANVKNSTVVIEFPVANGEMQRFKVADAPTFSQGLQQKFPNIRSFVGQGIDDPTAIARFSTSPNGVSVMIQSAKNATFYIDPYTTDRQAYIGYSRNTLPASTDPFLCMVEEEMGPRANTSGNEYEIQNADDGKLRTFRLALACTGEYAQYHWQVIQQIPASAPDSEKIAAVLTSMNVAMTRVNGIYERDLAVTMELVPNNDEIIFLNASTDPYTNNNGSTMLGQNQSTVDNIIGSANYDIGHVFSTGGGGIAQLRSPCVSGSKARGVTGLPSPIGDPFYIDYVCHEMGHQYGGNHTQNNNCQRSNASYEPGSASTIMGYAGICPPNVQNVSDDYFHAISIQEMWNNVRFGQSQCGAESATNNLPPVADAGEDYTVPKSTPLMLTGSATDPDGDALSYCWEQFNNQVAPMPPQNTSTTGPAFRSVEPTTSPVRYLPAIGTVLNGQTQNTWEVIPSVGRNMNFRLTVRDNAANGGSSANDNMLIVFDGNSGPFVVTSQTDATTWTTQTTETVTWDVAGTDVAPVNCANVDILFSTDGGQTYDITIALNVPNTGTATIDVPNINTTTGRMMIKGSDNIFYNVNGDVITVQGELSTEDFAFENFAVYPNPSNGTFNLSFKPASNDDINVSLYDLRGRLINEFVFDDASAGTTFNKALDYGYINSGMYFLVVKNGNKVTTKKVVKN